MEGYLLRIDKELLELGAVEYSGSLEQFADSSGSITLESSSGQRRSFTLDTDEKLIRGRGIKGFFKELSEGEQLVQPVDDALQLQLPMSLAAPKKMAMNEHDAEVLHNLSRLEGGRREWFELCRLAEDFSGMPETDILVCLSQLQGVELYEYQMRAVRDTLRKYRGRVLFCDEVGLGKTIEAGMAMMEYIMRGLVKKILILVPPSLVDQWFFELKFKFNQDFIRADDPEFKKAGDKAWARYPKVVASLAIAKRKNNAAAISELDYDLVILDEAHHLKNRKSVAWQFVNSLRKKYIFLLTATPVQNSLEELYNLITLLKPGQLRTYSYFKNRYVRDSKGLEAKNTGELRRLLDDVMIRNRRSNVDIIFPKRQASTILVRMTEEERLLYNKVTDYIRSRYDTAILSHLALKSLQEEMGSGPAAALQTLERLRENERLPEEDKRILKELCDTAKELACGAPGHKLLQVHRLLEEFGDKMIVFTKYKATLEALNSYLTDCGYTTAVFHGGLRRKDKEAQIEAFRNGAQVLISTESGGEGRNLQFCCAMINYDLPWNPMAIEQRIGRIHRIGQERTVRVYNLAAADTVEYYILDLLDRKINMFELVVGETDMLLGDIESESDFSDIIMDAWAHASDIKSMEREMQIVEERLMENRKQVARIQELDDKLFAEEVQS